MGPPALGTHQESDTVMIVGRGDAADGEKVVLLGVTADNIQALMSGKPILVSRATHGPGIPEGWKIAIVYGKDTKELYATLSQGLAKDAQIHHEPLLDPKKMPGGGG